jgi:phosphatidylethanolamine-binding protein (PEBP) family uncharacterized protein
VTSRTSIGVALLFALSAARGAAAHDPREEVHGPLSGRTSASRSWTHEAADVHFAGSYLASRDGKVSIQSDLGPVVTLEVARLSAEDQAWVAKREQAIVVARGAAQESARAPSPTPEKPSGPWQASVFAPFAPFVTTRSDERWLYVESDGLPHPPLDFTMMVGIRAWQQQVPLPQPYRGANAWQIPLSPELAEKPISGRHDLMRGAIALAANGIPIFNALNNRGDDTFAVGELDAFGGHCGRGDDYHYHIAPLAIERIVGKGKPIAFALDGFPIYGLFDSAAKPGEDRACPWGSHEQLDELNGHFCEVPAGTGLGGGSRSYHYHASTSFPYINGGMRGKVTLEGDGPESQVAPQPRAQGVRPALQPMRGANITGFKATGAKSWLLEYHIGERKGTVAYAIQADGTVAFEFTSIDGTVTKESYAPRQGGGGGRPPRDGPRRRDEGRSPPPPGSQPPPPPPPPQKEEEAKAPATSGFSLTSSGLDAKGLLDARYTCDGDAISPPFAWRGAPKGTKSFALTIHHITPDQEEKVYLVLSGIDAGIASLDAGQRSVGTFGLNSLNRRPEFAPPCSQGPGEKRYTATLYALSGEPTVRKGGTTRAELLDAIKNMTLATTTLDLRYARPGDGNAPPKRDRQKRGERAEPEGRPASEPATPGAEQGLLARMTAFKTDVPERDVDVILARPTSTSITLSVGVVRRAEVVVEYWVEDRVEDRVEGSETRSRMPATTIDSGTVALIELDGLKPSTEYRYRLGVSHERATSPVWGEANRFRTQAAPSTPFTFTIQADSHLDQGVTPAAYEQTLRNMLGARPDFVIDLGDTFMTDKRGRDFERALPQYDAQRYYFGLVAKSAPLFMVLGNHDGEKGSLRPNEEGMALWSYRMRTERFPPPLVGALSKGMYTGRTAIEEGRGANYYAFEWGDAQIIVLDPFWFTTERVRGGGGSGGRGVGDGPPLEPLDGSWASTLGRTQYDWLAATLAATKARYTFVFIHHLVGGKGGAESRGGVESAPFFEWGGRSADGSDRFAEERPGWPMSIHDLLVKHKVSAVFHGHDHLYVHAQKDGIHYQCVPQPGNVGGNTRSAEHYGYVSGTQYGSPGHLRVEVRPDLARVEFVRTALTDGEGEERPSGRGRRGTPTEANGAVVDAYELLPRGR